MLEIIQNATLCWTCLLCSLLKTKSGGGGGIVSGVLFLWKIMFVNFVHLIMKWIHPLPASWIETVQHVIISNLGLISLHVSTKKRKNKNSSTCMLEKLVWKWKKRLLKHTCIHSIYRIDEKDRKIGIPRIRQCWKNNPTAHAERWSHGTTCSHTTSK